MSIDHLCRPKEDLNIDEVLDLGDTTIEELFQLLEELDPAVPSLVPQRVLTVPDLLDGAADWLEANGWTQGRPYDEVDGVQYACANGALWKASGFLTEDYRAEEMAADPSFQQRCEVWYRTIQILTRHLGEESFRWNDSIGQTKERVIMTFRILAEELRTEEEEPLDIDS